MTEPTGEVVYSKEQAAALQECRSLVAEILRYGSYHEENMADVSSYRLESDHLVIDIDSGFDYQQKQPFNDVTVRYDDPQGNRGNERYKLGLENSVAVMTSIKTLDERWVPSDDTKMSTRDITELTSLLEFVRHNPEITEKEISTRLLVASDELRGLTTIHTIGRVEWGHKMTIDGAQTLIRRIGFGKEYHLEKAVVRGEDTTFTEIAWTVSDPLRFRTSAEGTVTETIYRGDDSTPLSVQERPIEHRDVDVVEATLKIIHQRMKRKSKSARPELLSIDEARLLARQAKQLARVAEAAIKHRALLEQLRGSLDDSDEAARMIGLSKLDDSKLFELVASYDQKTTDQEDVPTDEMRQIMSEIHSGMEIEES